VPEENPPHFAPAPLPTSELYRPCDPALLPFTTTAEVEAIDVTVGQSRAVSALKFGVSMRNDGYNLFVLGRSGSHRHRIVRDFLKNESLSRGSPCDWCYLNNFEDERKPLAVRLPAGRGAAFRQDMARLIEELRGAIPAAFESEHYRNTVAEINQELEDRHRTGMESLQEEAKQAGLSLVPTPHGFAIAPTRGGKLLTDEEFERLPEEDKKRTTQAMQQMSEKLRHHIEELPKWHKERRDRVKSLNREVTEMAEGQLVDQLKAQYAEFPQVVRYLDSVREDVLKNARDFLPQEEAALPMTGMGERPSLSRYEINLLVDHSADPKAPIVYEQNPSVQNLLGRIEHLAQFGALVTNFTMIRPGVLHNANGGFLILDAERVLMEPLAWRSLKRVLHAGEIRIESLGELLSLVSTVSLEPQPIPLELKVILVGERMTYYLLCELDPDFPELFKVAADFENRMDRTEKNTQLYGQLIANLTRREDMRPLSKGAVARVIEHSARLLGDSEKLTTRLRDVGDLLREANFCANEASVGVVEAEHVQQAIDSQTHRLDRLRAEIQEEIQRNSILIDTDGAKVGQVNGLSVLELGNFSFGQPTRITAGAHIGEGKIIDIERETELGGAIHSKGVLILTSYLTSKYASDTPLSVAASLVFEQSYGGVEGDSASVAETCALLSALSGLPIKQSLAVTGSVNQHGQIQVIGAVNEKIEGFFDICRQRGLTGDQGVLIPKDNVKHLMLRRDVVEAAAKGQFSVYPVETIDEAIAVLTGVPAGQRDESGKFPQGTVNRHVDEQLTKLADARRAFDQQLGKKKRKKKKRKAGTVVAAGKSSSEPPKPRR
jgi:lon-related putative ATP-dependent protease